MGGRVQPRALERLSTAVSSRRDDALAAWRSAVRDAARARGREPALLDLGPALFGQLLEDPSSLELPPGADPAAVSEELALLREALEPLPRAESRAAGRAVAELQRVAAEKLALAHGQALRAVERQRGAPDRSSRKRRRVCASSSWSAGSPCSTNWRASSPSRRPPKRRCAACSERPARI